ncbi:MAG: chromate transporter [Bacteroidales bacterium]|nr:chromate transporter [Bacteroidales bacterium]MDD4671226.1 chromate transporter [Bacteroidales bacterium]
MLWQLFYTFLKIGAFTFGSGYAMIPMIEKEVIDRRKWFDKEDFLNQFTLAQSSPGPFALNTAVFVGYKMKGWWGAFVSVLGIVIPSFTIILVIAMYLSDFKDNPNVAAAFKGIRPAVIALIAVPCFKMLKGMTTIQITISVIAAAAIWLLGLSPIYFILAGSVIGIITTFYKKS